MASKLLNYCWRKYTKLLKSHTAVPILPTTWPQHLGTRLSLSIRHIYMNEGSPPTAKLSIHHNINIKITSSLLMPSEVVRNLGVVIHDELFFLSQAMIISHLIQAMVISYLDFCNTLLECLPACAIRPLQLVQNSAAWLAFDQPKRLHVAPLLIDLPMAAQFKYKSYKLISGSAPS